MSLFSEELKDLKLNELVENSRSTSAERVSLNLEKGTADSLSELAALLSPVANQSIEKLAQLSQRIAQRYFGKVIRMFAPLYLSNECINVCKYCGFSRTNSIPRITVSVTQVVKETELLARQGFRSILLVAGEHPKFVSNGYVGNVIKSILPIIPSLAIEIAPMETEDYLPIVEAGCEGMVVYQETYHNDTYKEMHTSGPKKNYLWRLDSVERGYDAGFRRLGIGALIGLYDWRYEIIALAAHAKYLLRKCWKAQLTISLPRLRPAAGEFSPDPKYIMSDKELVQVICALRMFLPTVGIIISTRESPELRDGLVKLGVTHMSAGASTEPGGYSHFDETNWSPGRCQEGEQFHIADERSPKEIAKMICRLGYEPVWKDFDQSLVVAG